VPRQVSPRRVQPASWTAQSKRTVPAGTQLQMRMEEIPHTLNGLSKVTIVDVWCCCGEELRTKKYVARARASDQPKGRAEVEKREKKKKRGAEENRETIGGVRTQESVRPPGAKTAAVCRWRAGDALEASGRRGLQERKPTGKSRFTSQDFHSELNERTIRHRRLARPGGRASCARCKFKFR